MKISIIVPTFNNLNYLKLLCQSLNENSNYKHQIIFHINNGSDGTLDFVVKNNFLYTHSDENIGNSFFDQWVLNTIKNDYVLYAHDDMYFCKNWDLFLYEEIKILKDNFFYFSGTNVSYKDGIIDFDCGNTPENFNANKFNDFCNYDKTPNLQGSHWAPHIVHRDLWEKIGGLSLEFDPGDGSDPDLCMKLWNEGVRTFKCISKFKVYHFGSVTTRKKDIKKNNGTKTFLLKYGFNPRFFRKYYLQGDGKKEFLGSLENPKITAKMLIDLTINKLKYFYFKIF